MQTPNEPRDGVPNNSPGKVPVRAPGQGWQAWHDPETPLRLGISSCLLGEEVRFDGGHCRDRFLVEVLGSMVQWVAVCPEMGIGMLSPRPSIRLEQQGDRLRLVAPKTGQDHTEEMQAFAQSKLEQLQVPALDGYMLKKNSPSCGLERLPIYKNGSRVARNGVGMYTQVLQDTHPDLPLEEEGRLNDAHLRERFITRIFSRNRWRALVARGLTRQRLVEFHTAHKLLLRVHDERGYRTLGTLLGQAGTRPDEQLFAEYGREFLQCIAVPATRKRHCNVLHHVMGYFKDNLSSADKQHLLACIEDFRAGVVPLVVPLALLRFNAEQHKTEYLLGQLYFDPYPKEWMLRNHT